MEDESFLLLAAQGGDERAFEALWRSHAPRLLAMLTRWTRDPEAARELAQDTWVKAWRALACFRGEAAMCTWLTRIAWCTAQDWRRANRPCWTISLASLLDSVERQGRHRFPLHLALQDPSADPLVTAARSEARARLRTAFTQLPPHLALVLALRDVEETPYGDISRILDVPVVRLRVQAHRARARLRALLEKEAPRLARGA